MPNTATARPTKYDLRRDAVVDMAAAVFAQHGYHGASTSLIAQRAGIRQGSLYYYFSSKEEALEEVCLMGVGDFLVGITAIAKSARDPLAKLRAAVHNHLHPVVDRTDYVRTFINQHQYLLDASRKSVGRQARQYEKAMIDLLRQGVMAGAFRSRLRIGDSRPNRRMQRSLHVAWKTGQRPFDRADRRYRRDPFPRRGRRMSNPVFRADLVGSLLRPDKLRQAFRAHAEGRIDTLVFQAMQDEAIGEAVACRRLWDFTRSPTGNSPAPPIGRILSKASLA